MWLQRLLGAAVAALVSWQASVSATGETPTVTTEVGTVRGVTEQAVNGNVFSSFYAIPYAEPPIGTLRFKDPVEAKAWSGVRDGSRKPSPCVHVPFALSLLGQRFTTDELPGSEDCLYLNVYMPKAAAATNMSQGMKGLPVMVFIHGGAFTSGSAEELPPYVLLSRDIVLVVMQYRLGFLGFLSTEDSVLPGNYGLKDQTLALHWVQKHIHNFGGDPQRVTIFGQSAGAASVHFQLLSPKARGLFSGAILQSGSAVNPWTLNPQHKRTAGNVGALVGCSLDKGSQAFLECMQTIDPRKVTLTSQQLFIWFTIPLYAVPRIDGDFIPDHPLLLLQEGRYNKVNIMSGITAHEGGLLTLHMYNNQKHLLEEFKKNFTLLGPLTLGLDPFDSNTPTVTNEIVDFYLGGYNFDPPYADNVTQMLGDVQFNVPHDITSLFHARDVNYSTFRYEFTHRGPWPFGAPEVGSHWVIHSDDLLYFQIPRPPPQSPLDLAAAQDFRVMNLMAALWTNFATYGHPTPDGSLGFHWNPSTQKDFSYLDFSASPYMRGDQRMETRQFLLSLPTETNKLFSSLIVNGTTDHNATPSLATRTSSSSSSSSTSNPSQAAGTTHSHNPNPSQIATASSYENTSPLIATMKGYTYSIPAAQLEQLQSQRF